jgi:hypothetical protein
MVSLKVLAATFISPWNGMMALAGVDAANHSAAANVPQVTITTRIMLLLSKGLAATPGRVRLPGSPAHGFGSASKTHRRARGSPAFTGKSLHRVEATAVLDLSRATADKSAVAFGILRRFVARHRFDHCWRHSAHAESVANVPMRRG